MISGVGRKGSFGCRSFEASHLCMHQPIAVPAIGPLEAPRKAVEEGISAVVQIGVGKIGKCKYMYW